MAAVDLERLSRSLGRTALLVRMFAIAMGASLGARALLGLWGWLRRPPSD